MRLLLCLCIILITLNHVNSIAFLTLGKILFDQIFGVLMFLGINTSIDTLWGTLVPSKDPIDELREKVMGRFEGLTSHIQQSSTVTINELNNYVKESQHLVGKLQLIDDFMKLLKSKEDTFATINETRLELQEYTIQSFSDGVVSSRQDSLVHQMIRISAMITGGSIGGHNFIDLFIDSLKRTRHHPKCDLRTSPQQTFIDFFKLIMQAEIRTLQLGNYAYALKTLIHPTKHNYSAEAFILRDNFYNRTEDYAKVLQNKVHLLSSQYFQCDPQQYSSDTFQKMNGTSPRVSLLPQVSDIYKNKVIVGIKLVVDNGILTFQVKEATLSQAFYTDNDAEWVPLRQFSCSDKCVAVTEPTNWKMVMKELVVPEGSVLTGIAFAYDSKFQLDIQVRYTQLENITEGVLDADTSAWMMEQHDKHVPKEFKNKVKESNTCEQKSFLETVSGQYFNFKRTENSKEATVVPFVDTQEVTPQPAMALSGAGVTFKGAESCGGFIAPVVLTLSDFYMKTVGQEEAAGDYF